jgi:DNA-binding response OmpR family regulator
MTQPPSPRILVIEDAADLRALVRVLLTDEGFEVHEAADGASGLVLAQELSPDLVILDVGLPIIDGVEVCRRLRTFSDTYVLMLTGRSEETDMLIGLSVGADAYVTKPFSPRELGARVKALLRRPRVQRDEGGREQRVFDDLRIDVAGRRVWLRDVEIAMTKSEFDLLDALSANAGITLTRGQLLERLWDRAWEGDDHVIDVHMSNLRHKIEADPKHPVHVLTVRGVGYRFGGRNR